MSAEENKAVVRSEQEELWNYTGNLDAADEIFAPEQAEAAKQEAADFREGFPDVVSTIEDLIAEGDKVVARWRARATHQGEYMGISPTGKEVEFTGISVYRIEAGKIAESWNEEDELGLMRQIGAIPEPEQSEEASTGEGMSNSEASESSPGQRLTHETMTALIPFAGTLGLELLSAVPERVEGRLAYSPERCTTDGVLHGGALMALADNFGGVCAYLNLPPGSTTSTIESKTNFFRAVREGHIKSVSQPLHVGQTTIAVQTNLFDEGGRPVAQTTQTQAVIGGAGR